MAYSMITSVKVGGINNGPSTITIGPATVSNNEMWQAITPGGTQAGATGPVTIAGAISGAYLAERGGPMATARTVASSTPVANGFTFLGWQYTAYRAKQLWRSGTTTNVSTVLFNASELNGTCNIDIVGQWAPKSTSGGGSSGSGGSGGTGGTGSGSGGDSGGSTTPSAPTYRLTFNGNGGTGCPVGDYRSGAGPMAIPNVVPKRTGYTFKGWSTTQNGTAQYQPGGSIYLTSNVLLYAVWELNSGGSGGTTVSQIITCRFQDSTTGAFDLKSYTIPMNGSTTITLPTSMSGIGSSRKLVGWAYAPIRGSRVNYALGASFYLNGDMGYTNTLYGPENYVWFYAVFEEPKKTYTVTFNANGGSCSISTRQVTEGNTIGSLPNATRSGYTFKGWYDRSSGGNVITSTTTVRGNMTLYAQWTATPLNTPTISATPSKVKRKGTINVRWSLYGSNIVFTVEYELNGSGVWNSFQYESSATSGTYTTLSTFNSARFRVRARNTSTGAYSDWAYSNTVEVDKGSAPTRPSSCTVRSNENDPTTIFTNSKVTQYDVSWTNSTDPDDDLDGYELQMRTSKNQTWQAVSGRYGITPLYTKRPCSALVGAIWVQYRVRAFDQFQQYSEWRESSQVTVSALNAPTWNGTGWIKYPVPEAESVREGEPFKIQWSSAIDKDGDLYRYVLAREDNENGNWTTHTFSLLAKNVVNGQPEWTDVIKSSTINKIRYRVYAEDQTQRTTTTITGGVVTVLHNTAPEAPEWIRALVEQNAIDEGHPYQMLPLKGGEYNRVLWAPAKDVDNNVVGYQLECSLDGELFKVIKGYDEGTAPMDLYFNYFIPKSQTERHDTAQFRVKAKDAYGEESPYIMSRSYNISNNQAPEVVGEHSNAEYIGTFDHGFPILYSVTDEEGDSVDLEIAVYDGNAKIKELFHATVPTPYEGRYDLNEDEFYELPMHRLTIRITARDREGEGRYWFDFTRRGTWATLTLRDPVRYPDPIVACTFTHLEGQFPPDCKVLIEVTNNANDPLGGYWEDCTEYVLSDRTYYFENKIATYGPAFNFRMRFERGPSGAGGYVSRVLGYFDTATEKGPEE